MDTTVPKELRLTPAGNRHKQFAAMELISRHKQIRGTSITAWAVVFVNYEFSPLRTTNTINSDSGDKKPGKAEEIRLFTWLKRCIDSIIYHGNLQNMKLVLDVMTEKRFISVDFNITHVFFSFKYMKHCQIQSVLLTVFTPCCVFIYISKQLGSKDWTTTETAQVTQRVVAR